MNKNFSNSAVNQIYSASRGLLLPSDDLKSSNVSEIDFMKGNPALAAILQKIATDLTPLDLASSLIQQQADSCLVNKIIILETCANELRSYDGFPHFTSEKGWRHLKEEIAELTLAKKRHNIDYVVDAALDLTPLFLGQLLGTHHATDWTSYLRMAIYLLHDEIDVWHRLACECTFITWVDSMVLRQRMWSLDHIPALRLAIFTLFKTGGILHPKLISYDYEFSCVEYMYPPEFLLREESRTPHLNGRCESDYDGESTCCMH